MAHMAHLSSRTKHILKAYVFMSPALLFYAIFLIFPLGFSLFISFREWNMLTPPLDTPGVGLGNYVFIFSQDTVFLTALWNTVKFVLVTVPVSVILALLLAVAVQQTRRSGSFWRFLLFMPSITAPVAVGLLWASLYRANYGLINVVINAFGLPSVPWLTDPRFALWSIMITYIWTQVGAFMLILYAGLRNVPETYYEAATVDGASSIRHFRHITVPLLRPAILFVLVTGSIAAWQVFDPIIAMSAPDLGRAGGPLNSTEVLALYMYQTAFDYLRMGRASAMAYVLFLIVLVVTTGILRIFREGGVESY